MVETEDKLSLPMLINNEYIELTQNSKGYTWTIKIVCDVHEKVEVKTIDRITALTDEMNKRGFGRGQ